MEEWRGWVWGGEEVGLGVEVVVDVEGLGLGLVDVLHVFVAAASLFRFVAAFWSDSGLV